MVGQDNVCISNCTLFNIVYIHSFISAALCSALCRTVQIVNNESVSKGATVDTAVVAIFTVD